MQWKSRFTRDYGIDLPFVSAGMAMLAGPELVAAVCEAGGLGLLGTGPLPPDLLRELIRETRRRTARPFGVDFIVEETGFGPATTAAHVEVCVAERVPLVVFFWNLPPEDWTARLRGAGAKVWATVSTPEEAAEAKARGFDAVIAQGAEAGGHVRGRIGTFTLVPGVRDAVGDLPLVAAGGIADGRGAAAALALGADAVCLGTRLVASEECPAHPGYKARIVEARASDTEITRIFGPEWPDAPMRVIRNRAVAEEGGARPGDVVGETVVFGMPYRMPHRSAVLPTRDTRGDLEDMCLTAGTSVQFVRSIEPAAAIVRGTMRDAAAHVRALAARLEAEVG